MKKSNLLIIAIGFLLTITVSCSKETRELRRTIYFYTEVDPAVNPLTLYVEGELIGPLNYVEGGIVNWEDRDMGLKHIVDNKKNTIVVKNAANETVIDRDIIVKTFNYHVAVGDDPAESENIGTLNISNYNTKEITGCLIGLNL